MTHSEYIAELNRQMATGMAREHSYRPALKQLLDTVLPGFDVTNEPRRIACGAPDFIIMRHADGLPMAFVETKDDGGKDENVFNIQQGVSINIFVKTGRKKADELGRVFHYDLYGRRQDKLDYLANHNLGDIHFVEVTPREPMYFFVPKDFGAEEEYNRGFAVNEPFVENSVGIVTTKDSFLICDTEGEVEKTDY